MSAWGYVEPGAGAGNANKTPAGVPSRASRTSGTFLRPAADRWNQPALGAVRTRPQAPVNLNPKRWAAEP